MKRRQDRFNEISGFPSFVIISISLKESDDPVNVSSLDAEKGVNFLSVVVHAIDVKRASRIIN